MNPRLGLITAAGASRRMGHPKVGLCFPDGTSFINHMAKTLKATGHDLIYLSLPEGALGPAFEAHLSEFGVKTISNPCPDHQQIGSIVELLRVVPTKPSSILVWPVDTPFAEQSHLEALYQAYDQHPQSGLVSLQVQHKGGHPLLLGASFFARLPEYANNEGLRGLADQFPQQVCRVAQTDMKLCDNINTPEQYRKAFAAEPQFLPNSLYFMQ